MSAVEVTRMYHDDADVWLVRMASGDMWVVADGGPTYTTPGPGDVDVVHCDAIVVKFENGQSAAVPWLVAVRDGRTVARMNAAHVAVIEYRVPS